MAIQDKTALSVVVPCYNEEGNIAELLRRTNAVCKPIFGQNYEIILVNDGSRDETWRLISEHALASPHIIGINLSRNYGHQLALTAGLEHCRGDLILILDADLQDPPEYLGAMVTKINEGFDVVYGQRRARAGETLFKKGSAGLFYRLLGKMVDVHIPRDTGDFRLITRRVLNSLNSMPERFRFIRGMISWIGFQQHAFIYDRDPRFAGTTNYPLRKMVGFAVDAITSFSVIPLRFASWIGIVGGLLGMTSLCWIMAAWLSGHTISGWASTTALILILGSIQLVMLGIFGEYLGRMYMEGKNRPLYIVESVAHFPAKTENPAHALQNRVKKAVYGKG